MSASGPRVDTHEMVLIHRVLRREFGQLPRLFRSAADDRARSKVIGAHAREMLDFLHTHHTGEDELLFPLLRERAVLDPELMDRMDAQHMQVDDTVRALEAELPAWTTSADAAAGERMATRVEATTDRPGAFHVSWSGDRKQHTAYRTGAVPGERASTDCERRPELRATTRRARCRSSAASHTAQFAHLTRRSWGKSSPWPRLPRGVTGAPRPATRMVANIRPYRSIVRIIDEMSQQIRLWP